MVKVIGKGKSQVGKMDAILTDPHHDTRIKICTAGECDCTKVGVCRRSMGREREEVRETTENGADDSS